MVLEVGATTFSTAGASATARETDDEVVVIAGSIARKDGTDTFPLGYRALRDRLVESGQLVEDTDPDLYRFVTDVIFGSPSARLRWSRRGAPAGRASGR